ncbi:MAG TPA: hypothetical protein VLG76_07810 [Rhabdochlamydiaceae bacterium]|nr:hypothetical protein [Rhabdochlamydiaceae bacterium]
MTKPIDRNYRSQIVDTVRVIRSVNKREFAFSAFGVLGALPCLAITSIGMTSRRCQPIARQIFTKMHNGSLKMMVISATGVVVTSGIDVITNAFIRRQMKQKD